METEKISRKDELQIIEINTKNLPKSEFMQFRIELILYHIITKQNLENTNYIEKELVLIELPINRQIGNLISENDEEAFYIKTNDLISSLKKKGYPILSKSKLYIYIKIIDEFIFLEDKNETISSSMLSEKNEIKLKIKNNIEVNLLKDSFTLIKNCLIRNQNQSITKSITPSFVKDIVKLVYKYRMLYHGFKDEKDEIKNCQLDEASEKVEMNKKTLDFYFEQIKFARKKEFDFNENKNEPISSLLDYNKKNGWNKRKKRKRSKKKE